ncbi:Hypothetical predicted protein [Mytilus galloprovincialis]|uniref:Uncharacterized protein n=1 Tax=Mytilus galloprovincialis TaxID=29158 RepID=A0A8B6DLW0_MYTGA|nr:Hypothetical predicted protein [Mytilus galloprovincialis]
MSGYETESISAIKKRGLDGAIKVATLTDCDDDSGNWISLESPEFLNEKGETCFECIENESIRRDEQKFLALQQTIEKAKVENNITKTNHRKKTLTLERIRGKYIEAAIKTRGWNRTLMVGTSLDCEDYRRSCISWDSPMNANKTGDMCFEKFEENESNREDEQSWWLMPQQTKDTWEEWDSDEESSISTELEHLK